MNLSTSQLKLIPNIKFTDQKVKTFSFSLKIIKKIGKQSNANKKTIYNNISELTTFYIYNKQMIIKY